MNGSRVAGVRARPRALRAVAGAAAVVAYLVAYTLMNRLFASQTNEQQAQLAWQIFPWLVGLPYLRRVSMSPSRWLLASFVPFASFWLLGRLVNRLLALPRRDWPPAWWELDRVVPLGRSGTWTLAARCDLPARIRLAPPPGSPLHRRLMWASRNAWPLVFAAIAVVAMTHDDVASWWAITVVIAGLVLVALAPDLAARAAAPGLAPAPGSSTKEHPAGETD